jgi:hypothetical protein
MPDLLVEGWCNEAAHPGRNLQGSVRLRSDSAGILAL